MPNRRRRRTRTSAGASGSQSVGPSSSENEQLFAEADIQRWQKCVEHWFPDLLGCTYFIPPVYMNRQHFSSGADYGLASPVAVYVASEPVNTQVRDEQALQIGHVREDRAQQRILMCLQELARKQQEVMIVLSQLLFGDFLHNPTYAAANSKHPRPIDLECEQKHKGDFDMIIIHRKYGLLAMEIKAVGDNFSELGKSQEEQDDIVKGRVECAIQQLQKATYVLKHLVSDHNAGPRVRGSLVLPNVSAECLRRVLGKFPNICKNLSKCLGAKRGEDPVDLCVCEEQLSDRQDYWNVTPDVLQSLEKWWQQRVTSEGPDPAMNDEVYADLARRFCGPATTVRVPCPRARQVHLRSVGEGVAETGDRFSQFVLLSPQLQLLQAGPPRAYVTGPPGTGKTLMLFLMAFEWAREPNPHRVDVLSTCNSSLAASQLIVHLLRENLEERLRSNVCFHDFDLEHGDLERAKQTLLDIAHSHGELYVVADEAVGNKEFRELCDTLCDHSQVRSLRLWAASTFHRDSPPRLTMVKLTECLRTPPVVTREVEKAGVISNWRDIYPYTVPRAPLPAEGPDVITVTHGGPQHCEGENVVDCEQCGREVADKLHKLHVGHTSPPEDTRTSLHHPDHLEYRDVFLLTAEHSFSDQPTSGFIRGLRDSNVPVRIVLPGDRQAARDVATHAGEDQAIATCAQTVNGLERKVVVWIQREGSWDDDCGRLMIASRSLAQLVVVGRARDEPSQSSESNGKLAKKTRTE